VDGGEGLGRVGRWDMNKRSLAERSIAGIACCLSLEPLRCTVEP